MLTDLLIVLALGQILSDAAEFLSDNFLLSVKIILFDFFNVKLCFAENTSHLREVAYGKKSYQSSTFVDNGTPYSSNLAVDGNMDTFMHTHSDNYPHWEVDLGKNYQIKRVEIYTRRNCCGK